ncbi:MAG: hypothetical protein KDK10_01145 [Maritimibacter sp.]|nr:hypothetical protein [Maritimibacter sp.]
MTTRLIGLYSVALGLAVAGLWAAILVSGDLPEGRRALAFHLLSEALMALGVMIGGALLLKGHRTGAGIAAAAHAMVVYSTLNAAGYYLQRGAAGVCGAMVLLAILSALLVVLLLGRLSDRAASA